MSFQPDLNETLYLDGVPYRVAEHPSASGMPYGQEGRAATVYQLVTEGDKRKALKVFKPRFRTPGLVALAEQIAPFASMQGLEVCRRTVLTARRYPDLIRRHPDLVYSVLMPWIYGPTWMEIMLEGRQLSPEQSLRIARALIEVLSGMEERRLAHCDVSGPNVLLPAYAHSPDGQDRFQSPVVLVDVEQMYGPMIDRPEVLTGGSSGYAHKGSSQGLWSYAADRFAGAVLIAEMLGWCDTRVRQNAWGESYFDPNGIQEISPQYKLLRDVLKERWGDDIAQLFQSAWESQILTDCPSFGEWLARLPETASTIREKGSIAGETTTAAIPASSNAAESRRGTLIAAPHSVPPPRMQAESYELRDQPRLDKVVGVTMHPGAAVGTGFSGSFDKEQLAGLFAAGLGAYEQGDWARAKELLSEVLRQQPDYRSGKQMAAKLLIDAERRLANQISRRSSRSPGWAWSVPILTLAVLLLLGVIVLTGLNQPRVPGLLPASVGTPVPVSKDVIRPENIDALTELADWQKDVVLDEDGTYFWSPMGTWLALRTTSGLRLFNGDTLSLERTVKTGRHPTFNPSESLIASLAEDGSSVVFQKPDTGETTRRLNIPAGSVGSFRFSPFGHLLMIWDADRQGSLNIWEIGEQKKIASVQQDDLGFPTLITPDELLLVTLRDQQLKAWDLANGGSIYPVGASLASEKVLAINENTSIVVTLASNGAISARRFPGGETISQLGVYTNTERLPQVTLSATGKWARVDDAVWDVQQSKLVLTLDFVNQQTSSQLSGFDLNSFDSSEEHWAVNDVPPFGPWLLWDLKSLTFTRLEDKQSGSGALGGEVSFPSPRFRPNGSRVAVGQIGSGGYISVLDTANGDTVGRLDANTVNNIIRLHIGPGDSLVSVDPSHISLLNLATGSPLKEIDNPASRDVLVTQKGLLVLDPSQQGDGLRFKMLQYSDLAEKQEALTVQIPEECRNTSNTIVFESGGSSLGYLAYAESGFARETHCGDQNLVAFYPTGSTDQPIRYPFVGSLEGLRSSPDGALLAVGVATNTLQLLQTPKLTPVQTLTLEAGELRTFDFSDDGKWLAANSDAGRIYIWETATWRLKQRLDMGTTSVGAMAFSPNGEVLAVAAGDKVQLWGVQDGTLLRSLDAPGVYSIAFSEDAMLLGWGSKNGAIQVWGIR